MIIAALCLSLALLLPFLTLQNPALGTMLCPMHIPVFLCAYVADRKRAAAVGFVAPILRSVLFGMPVMYPVALSMSFELAVYGFVCGLINEKLPKTGGNIYVSLISAMIIGRGAAGLANAILYGFGGMEYTWKLFFTVSFVKALPGIALHIAVIPVIVMSLRRAKLIDAPHHHDKF